METGWRLLGCKEGKKNSFKGRSVLLCFARWHVINEAPSGVSLGMRLESLIGLKHSKGKKMTVASKTSCIGTSMAYLQVFLSPEIVKQYLIYVNAAISYQSKHFINLLNVLCCRTCLVAFLVLS